jgi:hypothetical protein
MYYTKFGVVTPLLAYPNTVMYVNTYRFVGALSLLFCQFLFSSSCLHLLFPETLMLLMLHNPFWFTEFVKCLYKPPVHCPILCHE